MELKDLVSVGISVVALALSAFATWRSQAITRFEDKRMARSELTNILSKFVENDIENAKLWQQYAASDPRYAQQVSSMLATRNNQLIQQARYWLDQVPDITSATDYFTLASASINASDLATAEIYYKKAIDASRGDVERAIMSRSYAATFFMRGRYEEGREYFRQALRAVTSSEDVAQFTNGMTYQIWGWQELNTAGNAREANERFADAEAAFNRIGSAPTRSQALQALAAARQTLAPVTPPVAVAPAAAGGAPA